MVTAVSRRALRRRSVALLVGVTALSSTMLRWSTTSPATATTGSYEVPTIADTAYAIPTGAYFVSPSGSDTNAGTQGAPFATIGRAVAVATSGATIVLRTGTYRESLPSVWKRLTIQPYPHEQAWLNGSQVVSGFTQQGAGWTVPWTSPLCHTCYPAAALDPNYPAAGLPDQVFVDGTPLQQVDSPAALTAGTFFVDLTSNALWLGSDPTGHVVEATVQSKALQFNTPSASGSIVRGIGFRNYGPHYTMDVPAMVVITSTNVTLDHDTFAWSATRGLSMLAAGGVVTDSTFLYNGLNGFQANLADGLDFERNRVAYSNEEHFSIAPSASALIGGVKVTTTQHSMFRNNVVEDNLSNGLWLDVSSYDAVIADNRVVRNAGQGIAFEVSTKAIIAGNVSANNGRDGIKVAGSVNVKVWNNTIVGNGWSQLGVYEDARKNTNPAQLALGITWDTANVRAVNNIVESNGSTRSVLNSFDGTNPRWTTSQAMLVTDDHNLWGRTVATVPKFLVSWQPTTTTTLKFLDVAAMQAGTARELTSVSADNVPLTTLFTDPANDVYTLAPGSLGWTAGAPLPADVAAAIGVAPGPTQLGAISVP